MNIFSLAKDIFIGKARNLSDKSLFHKVSLIALFAWVGLGADGLSSSCYGPEEAFRALGAHGVLAPFIALACMVTIAVICASYSQIIEVFPGGGGGYLVASKLLSPGIGVVSGCALMVDYVLTIAISIASGADALFSLFPAEWQAWKLPCALGMTAFLTLLNLRGVRESVLLCMPIFFLFLATHAAGIIFAISTHLADLPEVAANTSRDLSSAHAQLGWLGVFLLLIRAYSMGAGTYTGIEAVSNGLPILREPRVATGKRTMLYMGLSLALTVGGLLICYLFYNVEPESSRTLNAVLFGHIIKTWPPILGKAFISCAMISAAALLLIAAQTGFLGGPRVLANMAIDRWFPTRFASLSDRFVAQNGILLMGGAALLVLMITRCSIGLLVVLYSINVFITFTLSQLGMVRHWWRVRAEAKGWKHKIVINGVGFCLTAFILVMLSAMKFLEGGWATLLVTTLLVAIAYAIRRHYRHVIRDLSRLNELLVQFCAEASRKAQSGAVDTSPAYDPKGKTAVILVNGFNGLGVHTLLTVNRMFPGTFRNFIFIYAGMVDAGNFKGNSEIERLREHAGRETGRYVECMRQMGFFAEAFTDIGADIIDTVSDLSAQVSKLYPQAVFFAGQLVFSRESWLVRVLHNYVVFALQRRLFHQGKPFLILPIHV